MSELSELELKRQENIRQNHARLAQLGLAGPGPGSTTTPRTVAARRPSSAIWGKTRSRPPSGRATPAPDSYAEHDESAPGSATERRVMRCVREAPARPAEQARFIGEGDGESDTEGDGASAGTGAAPSAEELWTAWAREAAGPASDELRRGEDRTEVVFNLSRTVATVFIEGDANTRFASTLATDGLGVILEVHTAVLTSETDEPAPETVAVRMRRRPCAEMCDVQAFFAAQRVWALGWTLLPAPPLIGLKRAPSPVRPRR